MPAHQYFHSYSGKLGRSKVAEVHFVSFDTYCKQLSRGTLEVVRQGKGEGNYALIAFDSIPSKYKKKIYEKYPDPEKVARQKEKDTFLDLLKPDPEAVAFFTNYRYEDGSSISTNRVDNIMLWSNNAAILNAIAIVFKQHSVLRAKLGKKPLKLKFFDNMAMRIAADDVYEKMAHNLPITGRALRRKYEAYAKGGYETLIKKLKGNKNREKIDDDILHLLCCLAAIDTSPYLTEVMKMYKEFMAGNREIYDKVTGEELIPANYMRKGKVVMFSQATVWNRLNKPDVQVRIDRQRYGRKDYNDIHRPHRHRHNPSFSFSKISMDDRDLVFKDKVTKKRVKAYYAYDVTSGCRVGSAYSMDKDEQLFLDCLRDMYVFCERNGIGSPLQVEVENHLVKQFEYELNQMFPIVNFCAPGNSQEKRAEHFNRYVKYQIEKNNHPGIGRWWLKSKYNRIGVDKVDDQFLETLKPADRLIVEDIQDTIQYNNSLHPNQDEYPGMTRMQVLMNKLNPDLPKINKSYIYRYIGYDVKTSIRRSQYVQVQYGKYQLPHPSVLERLGANNRDVTAYYMPEEDGNIPEVHLYQNDTYICTCEKIITYNEAIAERTEADWEAKLKQDKYVAEFDKYSKANYGKIKTMKNIEVDVAQEVEVMPDDPIPTPLARDLEPIDYAQKALEDFYR